MIISYKIEERIKDEIYVLARGTERDILRAWHKNKYEWCRWVLGGGDSLEIDDFIFATKNTVNSLKELEYIFKNYLVFYRAWYELSLKVDKMLAEETDH